MTAWSDLPDEMRRLGLDDDTLERLLAGRIAPEDAPPGYSDVARVLQAAVASVDDTVLAREDQDVAAAVRLVDRGSPASRRSDGRSRQMKTKSHRVKAASLMVIGTLAGSAGLAVAGVLPDAAQDALAGVLDRVGISVPVGSDHPASSGEEISGIATTSTASGVDKGAEVSSVASGGVSQAGEHGSTPEAGGAPVTTPNDGGTDTADAASGGASDVGTDTGDDESDGRSEAGSGNAAAAAAGSPPSPASPPSPPSVAPGP